MSHSFFLKISTKLYSIMKKYPLLLSALLILFITSTKAQDTAPEAQSTINYNSLDWFRKGTAFLFTTRDGAGQVIDYSRKKIENVQDVNQNKSVLIKVESKTNYQLNWLGTSEKLWMDYGTAYSLLLKNIYPDFRFASNNEPPTQENGMYSIPLQLTTGVALNDVHFQVNGTIDDKEVKFINTLTERKVEGLEELKTPAGKFNCFKISALSSTTIESKGKIKNLIKPSREYIWFDVHSGIIKMESHDLRGKLISISYVTEIKK